MNDKIIDAILILATKRVVKRIYLSPENYAIVTEKLGNAKLTQIKTLSDNEIKIVI